MKTLAAPLATSVATLSAPEVITLTTEPMSDVISLITVFFQGSINQFSAPHMTICHLPSLFWYSGAAAAARKKRAKTTKRLRNMVVNGIT